MYDVSCAVDVLWTEIAWQFVSIVSQTARSRDDWADVTYDVFMCCLCFLDGNCVTDGEDWADAMYDVSCAVDVHLGRKTHDRS
eukprot:698433-Hanusia_phi.AAC.1